MQQYADYIKEILPKYKFYRNGDLFERAEQLLKVGDTRPIFKNKDGKIYCIENSLRIFLNDGGVLARLTNTIAKDRKYNFVILYLEGSADLSDGFNELKCNTFTILCVDDTAPIIMSNVFNECTINTVSIYNITVKDFDNMFTKCSIGNCAIAQVHGNVAVDSDVMFASMSTIRSLTIGDLDLDYSGREPLFVKACNISKWYIDKVPAHKVADNTTVIKRLLLNSSLELPNYDYTQVCYLEIPEPYSKDTIEKINMCCMDVILNTVMFSDMMLINRGVLESETFMLPNSYKSIEELSDKLKCQLQCATHCVKGQECITYINPDLKYVTLYLPPVEKVSIYGPAHMSTVDIEVNGVRPQIYFKGELRKAYESGRCLVNKVEPDSIICDAGVKKSDKQLSVFSGMFANALSAMGEDISDVSAANGRVLEFKVVEDKIVLETTA